MKVTKLMLTSNLSKMLNCSKVQAITIIDCLSKLMLYELSQDNTIIFGNLGNLSVLHPKSRNGVNPTTMKIMNIQPKKRIKFKTSKFCKDHLNK